MKFQDLITEKKNLKSKVLEILEPKYKNLKFTVGEEDGTTTVSWISTDGTVAPHSEVMMKTLHENGIKPKSWGHYSIYSKLGIIQ